MYQQPSQWAAVSGILACLLSLGMAALSGFQGTNEGVCNDINVVIKSRSKMATRYSNIEYTEKCGYRGLRTCRKTKRERTQIPTVMTYKVQQLTPACCHGYYSDNNVCTPFCEDPCQNGKCIKPNTCSCDYGFQTNRSYNYICDPVCVPGCVNGNCVEPNSCACNDGYLKDSSEHQLCNPICSKSCTNGICTSPEVCTCKKGYRKDTLDEYKCWPICNETCQNGICVLPDICSCNNGYTMDTFNKYICHPKCKNPCENGTCTSPEVCTCNPGYQKDTYDRYKCLPVCSKECENGECVNPDTCRCKSGYIPNLSDPYLCDPFCEPGCVNAQCIKPDECECFSGYKMEDNETSTCKPICSLGCQNSDCVKPEYCECWEGYEAYDKPSLCVPTCSQCQYGICVAPETCQCWSSYDNPEDTNSTCVPVCDGGCTNSFCRAPNQCSCDEGFKNSTGEWNTCSPVCSKECINSNCTDPENCECFPGFEKNTIEENKCLPFCNDECLNGLCTDPEVCTCLWGFQSFGNSSNCSISDYSASTCTFKGLMTLSNKSDEQEISPLNISMLSNLNGCAFLNIIFSKNLPKLRNAELVIILNCSSNYSDSEVQHFQPLFECEIETVTKVSIKGTETSINDMEDTDMEDSHFSSTNMMQYEGSSVSVFDYSYEPHQTNSLDSYSTIDGKILTVSTFTGSMYEESFTTQYMFEEVTSNSQVEPQILHESDYLQTMIERGSNIDGKSKSYERFEHPSEDYVHDEPVESLWFEHSTFETELDKNSFKRTEDYTITEESSSSLEYFSTVSTDYRSSVYRSEHESTTTPSNSNKIARTNNVKSFELIINTFSYIKREKMTTSYFENDPIQEASNHLCFCSITTKGSNIEVSFQLQLHVCPCVIKTEDGSSSSSSGSWTRNVLYLALVALVLGLVLRGLFVALCLRRSRKSGDYLVAELEKDGTLVPKRNKISLSHQQTKMTLLRWTYAEIRTRSVLFENHHLFADESIQ